MELTNQQINSLKLFTKNRKKGEPCVGIFKTGVLSLNAAALALLPSNTIFVKLYSGEGIIALEGSTEKEKTSFSISKSMRTVSGTVSARRFLEDAAVDFTVTRKYPAYCDSTTGYLVIELASGVESSRKKEAPSV